VELGLPQDASWRQLMVAAPINTILVVTEPLERELAVRILQIPDVVSMTVDHLTPHVLCDHVFGLAQTFHAFYNSCRVGGHPRRSERIVLCAAADCALRTCLQLLGVYAPDKL
jgi:arginyl-tRNA synthetase